MLCCILVVALLGPLGLLAVPRAKVENGSDCCTGNRRRMAVIGLVAISAAGLCLAGFLLHGPESVDFRNICSIWGSP